MRWRARVGAHARARPRRGRVARRVLPIAIMLDSDTARGLIKPRMTVVCLGDAELGTVDHLDGKDAIRLAKDDRGEHHHIPLSWVRSVDDRVHIDRSLAQAMREWSTTIIRR
jgi:hypothetical protein